MATSSQSFSWPVRVYFEDTDSGGVVYYANYLKFFERARSEWLRAIDVSQQDLIDRHKIMFVVAGATVDYLAPARLDDDLKITVSVKRLGRASVEFAQQVWCANTLLTNAQIKVACVGCGSMRPQTFPQEVLEKIRGKV
ncbi:MAG: tol-pal system-associated acyl-CoA thioesterase [Burkholderiaceae bacterium]|nr:tol-pal system-associated acyl-CoA thioesterase [Burkholderiaceae bacterium]